MHEEELSGLDAVHLLKDYRFSTFLYVSQISVIIQVRTTGSHFCNINSIVQSL